MRTVVYTTRISPMFEAVARRWHARGVTPDAVVIQTGRPSLRRALSTLRRRADDSAAVCRRLRWLFVRVMAINDASTVDTLKRLAPDLAVNAGAGILRSPILGVPRAGTLGAHMGLLPAYRGMNVAEWAALNGDAAGCSVFWIDEGIDTGTIAATAGIDVGACRSIQALRARVNDAQITLLADVARTVMEGGTPPASRAQSPADGRQFYRMHPDLRGLLERRLAQA